MRSLSSSARVSPIDDIVLEQRSVVGYLNARCKAGHLLVERSLLERSVVLCSLTVIDCLSEQKEDSRSEVLPLEQQVVVRGLL